MQIEMMSGENGDQVGIYLRKHLLYKTVKEYYPMWEDYKGIGENTEYN